MAILTRKRLQEIEDYYYWTGYKSWHPFPKELKVKLLDVYGKEPSPYSWTDQDIDEGSRKMITDYFDTKPT
ncbi:hypothetical protein [Domibacillus enclensis]|uniref:Uncharacterized protein n=1 Tax=Domibacillus enclensis TaxID=1017273 RepID=A0A1N6SE82_9BACI|nr:hypothetical protein [Domibacillus enclensis]OXS79301.1 hypothetical protein B1B05_05895 [Domibacillus enclensis]SIQ39418.1 hypothetical protein SAMN05443094_102403 [Domibacillus enclensis]